VLRMARRAWLASGRPLPAFGHRSTRMAIRAPGPCSSSYRACSRMGRWRSPPNSKPASCPTSIMRYPR
jgi:hypothetical protein